MISWKTFAIVFVITLFGMIGANAFEFDNIKSYDIQTKTATITNSFGMGAKIADVKLETPTTYYVMPGENRKVAEFTIDLASDSYSNPLDKITLYNNKDGKVINRNLVYKQKSTVPIEVLDFVDECVTAKELNQTGGKDTLCDKTVSGSHTEYKESWNDIDLKQIAKGTITIGIFADVKPGDSIEWVPTIFGKDIPEWATWTDAMSVGLNVYHNFNSTSNLMNSARNNLTLTFGSITFQGANCIIPNCGNFWNSSMKIVGSDDINFGKTNGDISMNIWIYKNITDGNNHDLFVRCSSSTCVGADGYCQWTNAGALSCTTDWTGGSISIAQAINTWMMLTYVRNSSGYGNFYKNGTLVSSGASAFNDLNVSLVFGSWIDNGSEYFKGTMDELSFWNISLNVSQVSDLYNGGAGMTFSNSTANVTGGIIENAFIYNGTVYETDNQNFALNITPQSNVTLNSAVLYRNNISMGTSTIVTSLNSSFIYNRFDIPIYNSSLATSYFYWTMNFTNSSGTYLLNSSRKFQNSTYLNFTLCDTNFTQPYLNITFRNETASTQFVTGTISASFIYYSGTGTVTKSYSFQNASENKEYDFCFNTTTKNITATGTYIYSNSYSSQRNIVSTNGLSANYTNLTLYLLPTSGSISVTFVVDNSAFAPLSGATVAIYRNITVGVQTLLSQAVTDSAGTSTFLMSPLYSYTIVASKTGFATSTTTLTPSQTTYSIILQATGTNASFSQYLPGITFSYFPTQQVLYANQTYSFGLGVNATYGNVVSCRISLTNASGGQLATSSGCTAYGGTATLSFNMTNNPSVVLNMYINVGNGEVVLDPIQYWITLNNTLYGRYKLKDWLITFNNVSNDFGSDAGRQSFTKVMIFFFIATLVISACNLAFGFEFTSPNQIIIAMFISIWVASIAGIFTIPYYDDGSYSYVFGYSVVRQYLVAVLSALFTCGFFLNKFRRESS